MRDEENARRTEAALQRGADLRVRLGVDGGERIVKNHDGRVLRQHPGNRGPLLLPAGERHAPLAHKGVVALGKALDRLVEAGGAGGLPDRLHGHLLVRDGDVFPQGTGEEIGLLQDHADILPQPRGLDVADIGAADEDAPATLGKLIELVEQQHHRGFAAAGAAEDAERRAGFHGKADVAQDLRTAVVGKAHVLEANIPVHGGTQGQALLLLLLAAHDIGDAVHRHARLAHLRDHAAEHAHRPGHHRAVGQESDVGAGEHLPPDAVDRAEHDHEQDLHTGEHVAHAPELGQRLGELHPEAGVILVLPKEAVPLAALGPEGAHDPHAGQVLLRHGGEDALVFVGLEEGFADLAVEMEGAHDDVGHGQHGDQRQLPAHGEHEAQRQSQQDHDADDVGHLLGHKVLHRVDVRGAALDDVAGVVLHVPGEGQALDVGKKAVPHGLDQCLGGLGLGNVVAEDGDRLQQRNREQREHHDPDMLRQIGKTARALDGAQDEGGKLRVLAAQHVVHRDANDLGREQVRQRRERGADHAQHKQRLAALQKAPDQLPLVFFWDLVVFHGGVPQNSCVQRILP